MRSEPISAHFRGALPGREGVWDVVVEQGVYRHIALASTLEPDFGHGETLLGPALFDIQVNGANGVDLLDPALSTEHITAVTAYLASYGVAWWIPTIITASPEAMESAVACIAAARRAPHLRQAIPGIHLEGPHISPEDGPRGAHPREWVCAPDTALFDRLMAAADGAVVYVTLSPEWPEAPAYIQHLRQAGVVASLGHHQGDVQSIQAAVDAGATLSTHLGNGAAPMMHRHKNPLWPQLADDRLTASIIADGHHLPDEALKTFIRAKTVDRFVLVSDCVSLAGMAPGNYEIFGTAVALDAAGKISLSGTDLLAGSACRLVECVSHVMTQGLMSPQEAFAAASSIPARLLGVPEIARAPEVGEVANFLLWEGSGEGTLRFTGRSVIHGRLHEV